MCALSFISVINLLSNILITQIFYICYNSNNAIPPIIQLLVALRFYATGSFLITVGDFCGISEMSAQTIVHRISPVIAALRHEFIKLPTTLEEIRHNQREFFDIARFIRVVGCIDCTHVKIQAYGKYNTL